MGTSWEEEPPTMVGAAAVPEEAAVCLDFGAFITVKSLKRLKKV